MNKEKEMINLGQRTLYIFDKITKEAILAITGMRKIIIECCPNKRVVYLALHAKKKRIKQKNFHRAINILENSP